MSYLTGGMELLKVSAAEFQRNIGRHQDLALTQPVAITRNGCDGAVLISKQEYQRLKRRDRDVLGLDDFTAADLAALEASRPQEDATAFDRQLKR